jgi:cellulose biosynthesis protein BcsQ
MPRKLTGPAKKFAVCARKGGVGKSTITWNLSAELAMQGFDVLTLEIEDRTRLYNIAVGGPKPDDRLTTYRMLSEPDSGLGASQFSINMVTLSREIGVITGHPKMADLEDMKDELTAQERQDLIARRGWYQPSNALRFVPGTSSLQLLDSEFALAQRSAHRSDFDAYTQLHRAISHFERDFDFIIMDTPPSLNLIQKNAAIAADELIFVLDFDPDSIDDYGAMYEFWRDVNLLSSQIDGMSRTRIAGVVYNMYRPSGRGARTHKALYKRYTQPWIDDDGALQDPLVNAPELALIPYDRDRLEGAMQARRPLCIYAPLSKDNETSKGTGIGTMFYTLAHNLAVKVGATPALAR